MDELQTLKKLIQAHKDQHPTSRRYPKEFWLKAVELAPEYGPQKLADELEIHYGNLMRKIKKLSPDSVAPVGRPSGRRKQATVKKTTFVQVPLQKNGLKQVTIELPHGIKLRIDL